MSKVHGKQMFSRRCRKSREALVSQTEEGKVMEQAEGNSLNWEGTGCRYRWTGQPELEKDEFTEFTDSALVVFK